MDRLDVVKTLTDRTLGTQHVQRHMAPMPRHDCQLSLALRPPPQPDAPNQPPFVTQPSPRRSVAAVGQLTLRTTQPTHECAYCADPPLRVEEHNRVRAREPQVKRLVIVAVGNPRLAREQRGLHITPLLVRRLDPARLPEVHVQMDRRKAGLRRELPRKGALARTGHSGDDNATANAKR